MVTVEIGSSFSCVLWLKPVCKLIRFVCINFSYQFPLCLCIVPECQCHCSYTCAHPTSVMVPLSVYEERSLEFRRFSYKICI